MAENGPIKVLREAENLGSSTQYVRNDCPKFDSSTPLVRTKNDVIQRTDEPEGGKIGHGYVRAIRTPF